MSTISSLQESKRDFVEKLEALRDGALLKRHLFSLELQERWEALESTFDSLRAKVEADGEKVAEGAVSKARELAQTVAELVRDADAVVELATPVWKVMTTAPFMCAPSDSLNRAAQIMWEHDCGAVPVLDGENRLVGIVTDRDICMAAYTQGHELGAISVENAMSRHVVQLAPEASLGHALRLMRERQLRRIPIVEDERLVGMITLADVARYVRVQLGYHIPVSLVLTHTLASVSEQRSACSPPT
jgi:CBS domain-containing protein